MLAKTGKPEIVYAIDKNPDAINYLFYNIKANKIKNVSPMLGDAKYVAKKLPNPDRIIMNLPHSAIDFLDTALEIVAPGGIIHLYTIQEKGTLDMIKNAIIKLAESKGHKPSINNIQELHSYSPSQQMFCFDILIS